MKVFARLVMRDLRNAYSGGAWLPLAFFILVATLVPFAVGPDGALLTKTGGGMLWIAALLSALLPIDRLLASDVDDGSIDQLSVRGMSEELIATAKLLGHWLSFGPPLMLAALPASALLKLSVATLGKIELGLVLGTPGLAAIGLIAAGVTLGLRRAGALAGLLVLPLAIPILVFGAGSLAPNPGGAMSLIAASSLLLVALAPFATGAALRAARS